MTAPSTDRAAVMAIIRALQAAGWRLDRVWDGEEDIVLNTEADALESIFDVDEAWLYVRHAGYSSSVMVPTTGWVYFVLGNEPFEVAADYTVNLEDALGPLFDSWDEEES